MTKLGPVNMVPRLPNGPVYNIHIYVPFEPNWCCNRFELSLIAMRWKVPEMSAKIR